MGSSQSKGALFFMHVQEFFMPVVKAERGKYAVCAACGCAAGLRQSIGEVVTMDSTACYTFSELIQAYDARRIT